MRKYTIITEAIVAVLMVVLAVIRIAMGEYMLAECRAYLQGTPCQYEVSEEMLATMA